MPELKAPAAAWARRGPGKVNTRAAQASFKVERRARQHVRAYISNVDLQLPVAVRQPLHQHGVVKVARGFAVDGDDGAGRESRGAGQAPHRSAWATVWAAESAASASTLAGN